MLLLLPWMRQSDGAEAFEEQMRTRASSRRGCGALVFAKKAPEGALEQAMGCGVGSSGVLWHPLLGAFRVRAWQPMSRGPGPGARWTPPESA